MKKMMSILATFALAGSMSIAAEAAPAHTPRIDHREARQQARIRQGVRSGELTRRETARLEMGQARIHQMERHANTDGTVTGRERARIQHAENVQSRNIYRQKHDGQARN